MPESRLDRLERILAESAAESAAQISEIRKIQQETAAQQKETALRQQETAAQLQETAAQQKEIAGQQKEIAAQQKEMAARQQYHDEAFERFDARMREVSEQHTKNEIMLAQAIEAIHALARIAESHERRIEDLEEGTES